MTMIAWDALKPGEVEALYHALKQRVESLSAVEARLRRTHESGHLVATRELFEAAEREVSRRWGSDP